MDKCIFCSIIAGKIQSNKLYEDENMIIIKDREPRAMLHYLLIPKRHYKLLADMDARDAQELMECIQKLPALTDSLGLAHGYRMIINQGNDANQTVYHLHIHLLGGEKLADF